MELDKIIADLNNKAKECEDLRSKVSKLELSVEKLKQTEIRLSEMETKFNKLLGDLEKC
jgi:prefoldin subunit 5